MRLGIEAQRIFRSTPHGMDVFAIQLINELLQLSEVEELHVFANTKQPRKGVLSDHPKLVLHCFSAQFAVWEQLLLPFRAKRLGLDVLHFTSNSRALHVSVPSITTLHDTFFLDRNPLFQPSFSIYQRLGNYYRRLLFMSPLIRKSRFVTVSHSERQRIQERQGLLIQNAIYNGRNEDFKPTGPEESKKVLKKHGIEGPFVVHFGNTDPKKNSLRALKTLVKVLQKHTEYRAVIIDFRREGSGLLSEMGLERSLLERFILLDYVSQKDLPAIYSAATALFYPSLFESFGIPQIEAMGCGTLVVSGNCFALKEVAKGAAIHVDPFDEVAMQEGLELALDATNTENEERRALGFEVVKNYQWSQTAKAYLKEYKSL